MCPRHTEIPIDQTQKRRQFKLLMQHPQCPAALLHNCSPSHGLAVETRAELEGDSALLLNVFEERAEPPVTVCGKRAAF
jgi:hypothetical protein